MKRVLVTGAGGFIGRHLCSTLLGLGYPLHLAVRPGINFESSDQCKCFLVNDVGPQTDWHDALHSVDMVVHLSARAHIMRETAVDSLSEFRRVNVLGTERLAMEAARCGVRRFVFMSSIGVNGNKTVNSPFSETDNPSPHDNYSLSKYEAEQALLRIGHETGMEVVILRAPLVYGPGVRAKFLSLLRLIDRGLPLPLGSIRNPRSLLYVQNLVDALILCLTHPKAVGKTYLVSDSDDLSMSDLIVKLSKMMDKKVRLLNIPLSLITLASRIIGKSSAIEQLASPLIVDSSLIRRELDWRPAFSTDEGLNATVDWYRNRQ